MAKQLREKDQRRWCSEAMIVRRLTATATTTGASLGQLSALNTAGVPQGRTVRYLMTRYILQTCSDSGSLNRILAVATAFHNSAGRTAGKETPT